MTYAFINTYMRRVQNEYLDLTHCNTNHKVSLGFDHISVEVFQRIEAYQINSVIVKTSRKHNYRQAKQHLSSRLNTDVASKIIDEYLVSYESIYLEVDVHYDPFIQNPVWRLSILLVKGLRISEFIIQLIQQMSHHEELGLKMDLIHFIGKINKLLKYI
jgi:hypothetical protein